MAVIERVGKAKDAREQSNAIAFGSGQIAQPGALRQGASMIARDTSHGAHVAGSPASQLMKLADHGLGSLEVVLFAGGAADLMHNGRSTQQFAIIFAIAFEHAEAHETVKDAYGKPGHSATVWHVRIEK